MPPQTPHEVLAAVRRMEDELDAARRASRARERELEDLRASVAAEQALERRQVVEDLERVVDLVGAGWRDTRGRLAAMGDELARLRRQAEDVTGLRQLATELREMRQAVEELRELKPLPGKVRDLRRVVDEVAGLREAVEEMRDLRRLFDEVAALRRAADEVSGLPADVAELRRVADEATRTMRSARIEIRLADLPPAPPAGAGHPDANGDRGGGGRPL